MPRETITEKAARLTSSGRITLRVLSDDVIVAHVRGDSAKVYRTGWIQPVGSARVSPRPPAIGLAATSKACGLVTLEPLSTKGP